MKLRFGVPAKADEWTSIFKGALVAGMAVALTYITQHASNEDFGAYGPVIVGVLTVLVNIFRKSVNVEADEPVK